MVITKIEWHPYRIPLRRHFTNAHGTLNMREGAIVEIHVEGQCSGIGEIAPMPEFGGATLHDTLAALPSITTQLPGQSLIEALNSLSMQREEGGLPAATACGLEIALLDALGKQE